MPNDNSDLQKKLIELLNSNKIKTQPTSLNLSNTEITAEDKEFLSLALHVIKKHKNKIDPSILKLLNRLKYEASPHGGLPLIQQNSLQHIDSINPVTTTNQTNYNIHNNNMTSTIGSIFNHSGEENSDKLTSDEVSGSSRGIIIDSSSIKTHFPDLLSNPFNTAKKRRLSDNDIDPSSALNQEQLDSISSSFQTHLETMQKDDLAKQLSQLISNMNPSEQHQLYNQLNIALAANNTTSGTSGGFNKNGGNNHTNQGFTNNRITSRSIEMSIDFLLQSLTQQQNPIPSTNRVLTGEPLILNAPNNAIEDGDINSDAINLDIPTSLSPTSPSSAFNNSTDSSSRSSNRQYICVDCSMEFRRSSDLKRHEKIHLEIPPNICPRCEKGFARKDALKRHIGTLTCNRNRDRLNMLNGDM